MQHVMSLDMHEKEKLTDEIYVRQPNILGMIHVLANLNVPLDKIEIVLFILLVLYDAFVNRSGLKIPLITEDMIEKANDNNTAMLNYIDKDGYSIIGKSMLNSPNKIILAFVIGHLNEHGFSIQSESNEQCVRVAKVIMDCFI